MLRRVAALCREREIVGRAGTIRSFHGITGAGAVHAESVGKRRHRRGRGKADDAEKNERRRYDRGERICRCFCDEFTHACSLPQIICTPYPGEGAVRPLPLFHLF